MKNSNRRSSLIVWLILGTVAVFSSCLPTVENEQLVYSNDFSDLDLDGFENARLFVFENDTVVGYYHNEEVAATIKDIPAHSYLRVTIEILVHDSWDGNQNDGQGGPDIWYLGVDGSEIFRTTFSNSPCESTYCLYQSYPNSYPRQNVPKSGAVETSMPGLCIFGGVENYTTRYSITKLVEHSNSELRLYMGDELTANNSADPKCDESWSLAKIEVVAIQTN